MAPVQPGAILASRFEFVRDLGAGGAGELVLVKDKKREDEACALKILRPRTRDPGLEPLFRGEFLHLAEIRHPQIVKVREFGLLESGEPYFTMDFVPGESCRAFVREDRLTTTEYVDLAAGVLGALAHIHARGIVHRDVKPENLIIRRGDGHLEPVLIDFGLAVSAGANRAGEASGTLPYIAPEVLAGAAADARADLFALGMVLFEVATGKAAGDRAELLRSPGVTLAPDRVRRVLRRGARGAVPRRYEDFVARLLAPAPGERYASAGLALRELAEMYGRGPGPVEAGPRPRLPEAPLVGREAALDALLQRLEALRDGTLLDALVVVAGPAGVGVTRLLATLRNHAAVSGCLVATGASLRDLAADLLGHPALRDGSEVGASPREHVFRIDAALHALPQGELPVLLLDDVHRMAEEECAALRDWIAALERREGRAQALLVLGGRSEGEGPGVEILRTAGRAVPHDLRDLSPLGKSEVRAVLGAILGQPRVSGDVVQALHRATGGNPRLLAELLQVLVDEGVLDLSGEEPRLVEERLKDVRLPEGVAEAATRRIARMPPGAQKLVARFALVAEPLPAGAAQALGGPELVRLLDERMLVVDRGRVRFPSELTRRGADTLKGAARKKALVETAGVLAPEAPAAAAALFVEAGEPVRAREVGLPAARRLRDERRHEEARRLLEALVGEEADLEAGRLLLDVLHAAGRWAEAGEAGQRLLARHADTEVSFMTAAALRSAGRADQALALLEGLERGASTEVATRVANAKAAVYESLGRYEEALHESKRAEAAAGSLLGLGGRIARVRANVLAKLGRRHAALEIEDRILQAADAVRDRERQAAFHNRGVRHYVDGATGRSLADLRAALAQATAIGFVGGAADALHDLGRVWSRYGRNARAVAAFDRSRGIFLRLGLDADIASVLGQEAEALLRAGQPHDAEQRLVRAETLPGHDRLPVAQRHCALARALGRHLAGDTQGAIRVCDELLELHALDHAPRCDVRCASRRVRGLARRPRRGRGRVAWDAAATSFARATGRYLYETRVGLSECAAAKGAWHLAERRLGNREADPLRLRTPLRARALLVRAGAALNRGEAGPAGRLLEEAVAVANRCTDAPLRAQVYATAASLLEEGELQRYLRQPTGTAAAALLEAARDIWALYGNETMLRKIDLHLSELPRPVSDPLGGPEADRLVKVLHITREMNREFGRDRLLGLILDRAIELTGAERGFVILLDEGRETVHLARNLDRESISEPERKISSQIIKEVVRTGRIVRSENAEIDQRFEEYMSVRQLHLKSIVAVPFRSGGKTVGALYLDNRFKTGNFSEQDERLLELFADQAVAAIDKAELVHELEGRRAELEELYKQQKSELQRRGKELKYAKRELRQHRQARGWSFDRIVTRSVVMQGVVREAKRVAPTELPLLISGENGTGKELIARAIHYASARQAMPFVALNCAAVADGLLEIGALRPRARLLHRRRPRPRGPLRGGRRRHAVPGRGRGDVALHAGEAPAHAGAGRGEADRGVEGQDGRRARHRRDERATWTR